MSNIGFKDDVFGKCTVCGGGGGKNDPDPGSAFSTEDHTGEGYILTCFEGRYMCQLCIKRIKADRVSLCAASARDREQKTLESFGVKKQMES